jgi:hypothetical protein
MQIGDIKDSIFGDVVAFVYSVEYQAHGLLHAHIFVFLDSRHKFNTSQDIDHVVCAELLFLEQSV